MFRSALRTLRARRTRRRLALPLVASVAVAALAACGGANPGAGANGVISYWLVGFQSAARLSEVRRRLRERKPRVVDQDHPVWLGRLLVQADRRVHRERRAGRFH